MEFNYSEYKCYNFHEEVTTIFTEYQGNLVKFEENM